MYSLSLSLSLSLPFCPLPLSPFTLGGSLSITRPYFDSSNGISVRVLRALLPWHQLLNHIYSALSNRPSSYIFVTDSSGRVLYHPLVPSNGRDDVLITEVETEGVIMNLLGQLSTTNLMYVLGKYSFFF